MAREPAVAFENGFANFETKMKRKDGRGRKLSYTELGGCKVRLSGDGTRITVEGPSRKKQAAVFGQSMPRCRKGTSGVATVANRTCRTYGMCPQPRSSWPSLISPVRDNSITLFPVTARGLFPYSYVCRIMPRSRTRRTYGDYQNSLRTGASFSGCTALVTVGVLAVATQPCHRKMPYVRHVPNDRPAMRRRADPNEPTRGGCNRSSISGRNASVTHRKIMAYVFL